MHLRETENLMKYNLLRLQINELLQEVRCQTGFEFEKQKIFRWATSFKEHLENMDTVDELVNENTVKNQNINGIVLENYLRKTITLRFSTPQNVVLIGSFATQTKTQPFLNIDFAVTMPDDCFDKR